MSKGIKELSEVIDALEVLVLAGKEVLADGKVTIADAPVALKLAQELPKLFAAFEGASEIGEEVKDIDADEAVALVQKLYAVAQKVK